MSLLFRPPSNAAGREAVALPAAATAAGREQRAPRAVSVAAAAGHGAPVGRPRHCELVPLHRGLRLDYTCKSNQSYFNYLHTPCIYLPE